MRKKLFAILFIITFADVYAQKPQRFALVIGNGNYRNRDITNLANPVNPSVIPRLCRGTHRV
jgi:hypothetical protein